MEAIEDNLLRISVIVIALIKFPQYASGFKQTLPSQMLKESDRKTCERFMHQEENKLIKGMKPKAKEKNNKNPITNLFLICRSWVLLNEKTSFKKR